MLALSCGYGKNASISSSLCVANNIEETRDSMGQDKVLIEASCNSSSSSSLGPNTCLMARDSKVTPTLEPNLSSDNEEEDDDVASLKKKGEIVFRAIGKKKIACSNFVEILVVAIESKKIIDELQSHDEEHEETIENLHSLADDFKRALLEEQTTKEALEETFALELSRVKETHDRALVVANYLKLKNDKLVFVNAKLLEDIEHLKNGSMDVESALTKLTESHELLKASYLKECSSLPSPLAINDDACATNSTSCEASILKENVELRAQLELLTSKYEKLEKNHEKLSSSNEDVLVSHARLNLAHEAISTKVTSCEPHVVTSTISTKNVIFLCASPSNLSTHTIATSCDELPLMHCFSNNEASTSSSTCVVTNHVEVIKDLEAQVTLLKKDLVKGHEGKSKLDKI
jgi:hypothetical protein